VVGPAAGEALVEHGDRQDADLVGAAGQFLERHTLLEALDALDIGDLPAFDPDEDLLEGVLSLDEWLRKHALQSHRSGGSRVFVTTETDPDVAGYYALPAGAVMPREAPARLVRGLAANQPVPVVLLERLAVDARHQGRQAREPDRGAGC
jgi:hypothetical protein